jgi:hypothetical protein
VLNKETRTTLLSASILWFLHCIALKSKPLSTNCWQTHVTTSRLYDQPQMYPFDLVAARFIHAQCCNTLLTRSWQPHRMHHHEWLTQYETCKCTCKLCSPCYMFIETSLCTNWINIAFERLFCCFSLHPKPRWLRTCTHLPFMHFISIYVVVPPPPAILCTSSVEKKISCYWSTWCCSCLTLFVY